MSYHNRVTYPFTAIVGQEGMRRALILNAINPKIGGVLIRGEKGTAKSTAARALADLLPEIEVVEGCVYGCDPADANSMCEECREKTTDGSQPNSTFRKTRVVDLPVSSTEDRVVGTLDIEHAIRRGEKRFEPGILAEAHRGILYVDEVNLLDDSLADLMLDTAAMGVNVVEREGVSHWHPARFMLVGTMNPEEGELRPQLLDRFGLCVEIEGIVDADLRVEVVKRRSRYEADPVAFAIEWEEAQEAERGRILSATRMLNDIEISDEMLKLVATIAIESGVQGHRADIVMTKTSKTLAAHHGRAVVSKEDVREAADLALLHRTRRKPFEEMGLDRRQLDAVVSEAS
ncbi:MAG: ATP-binding protein [Actinomycetota bacterium]|nr:ATP-binding protein [Actinomycetota bacterium]